MIFFINHPHMQIVKIHFNVISSTNTWAKENCLQFDPGKITLITATEQSAGRGRFLHQWYSPPRSNLYATFCFFCDSTFSHLGQLSIFFSLITSYLLESFGFEPRIKWPNDLFLSGKKVGGVLCETRHCGDKICIVAGIGLNINMTADELQAIDCPATSLFNEKKKPFDVQQIVDQLEKVLVAHHELYIKQGLAPFFLDYTSRLNLTAGQPVSFKEKGQLFTGTFKQVNSDGSLLITLPNGSEKPLFSHWVAE